MAYANPRFGGYRPLQTEQHPTQHPTIDSKRSAYFAQHENPAVLDPAILDADIMQSPNRAHFRKAAYANSNGVLSPADSHGWDHHYGSGLPIEPASAGASNPYHEEGSFLRQNTSHVPPLAYQHQHQPPQWQLEQASGNCTPTGAVDFMPPPLPLDSQHYGHHHRQDSAHASFSHPPPPSGFHGAHVEANFVPAPQVQTPMSPHSHQDWMGMAQQEMECRPIPKRMRPNSPPRTVVDFQRRDGIRKKNGRIDIPTERNIHTIDELIDKTTDEDTLKELKQQKRLLRNREAALASRQRKKKHTEDLEVKEKSFTTQISMLEKELQDLSIERNNLDRDRQILFQRNQEAQRINDTMQDEKRDLIMRHTEETSSLRKKIQVLTDQLEAGPAPAMSAAPSSTGFTDFNAEMEALNMGPHDWDNFIFVNELQTNDPDDFTLEPPQPELMKQPPVLEKKTSSSTVVPSPPKPTADGAIDQPIASGLLFMLLLCGAFVASKSASSAPPDLSKIPQDVRAAAPTVLNNLLSEAGTSAQEQMRAMTQAHHEPAPSGVAHGLPHNTRISNRLEHMHQRLTTPTKQQQRDSAFALTTAQYASLTNTDFIGYNEHPTQQKAPSQPRRNLAEAMEQRDNTGSKAEVYTRSLLWDQIPTDVVRQFREMVRDHEEIEARDAQRTSSHDELFDYKIET